MSAVQLTSERYFSLVRRRADDPTIRVSCGHRVPRIPVKVDGKAGHRYWCEECGSNKMSGNACTGELAFDFLLELRDEVERCGIVVDDPGTRHGRDVVLALGARFS